MSHTLAVVGNLVLVPETRTVGKLVELGATDNSLGAVAFEWAELPFGDSYDLFDASIQRVADLIPLDAGQETYWREASDQDMASESLAADILGN